MQAGSSQIRDQSFGSEMVYRGSLLETGEATAAARPQRRPAPHTQLCQPMYMRQSLSGSCASASSCCTWPSTPRASPSPARTHSVGVGQRLREQPLPLAPAQCRRHTTATVAHPTHPAALTRLHSLQLLLHSQQRALGVGVGQAAAVGARRRRAARVVVVLWRSGDWAGGSHAGAAIASPSHCAQPHPCAPPWPMPGCRPPRALHPPAPHLIPTAPVVLAPVGGGGGEGPLVEWVMDEDLDHCEERALVGAQHLLGVGAHACWQYSWWRASARTGGAAQSSPAGCPAHCTRPPPAGRRTRSVSSQQRRMTPSTPASPMPSTRSRVRRKGTSSGVFRKRPWGRGDAWVGAGGVGAWEEGVQAWGEHQRQ